MADEIGTDIATIKAVFEVEAAGRFYESNGKLPRRFEPHHFPRAHWARLGFSPNAGQAAWRASLALSTSRRRTMFDIAENIDAEAAYDATSWGAPQIMGFNAELAGHASAIAMVSAMEQHADNQIRAFVAFCIRNGLDTHLRSHNFLAFATGYNGSGQAPEYARRIESAYRRQSGGVPSATVLRVGSYGSQVEELQKALKALGFDVVVDGDFGTGTATAVRAFQNANGLLVDGVAGAATQRAIAATGQQAPARLAGVTGEAETVAENTMDKIIERGTLVLGSGGAAGLLGNLNENAQTLLVGGGVVGALIVLAVYVMRKKS